MAVITAKEKYPTIYRWEQHYGIDRFDLSGPRGFPVGGLGWITRCPNEPGVSTNCTITRDPFFGYISSMKVEDSVGSSHHWRMWWDSRDEERRVVINTDSVRYKTRREAMKALEEHFNISPEDVKEIRWEGNLSAYMND